MERKTKLSNRDIVAPFQRTVTWGDWRIIKARLSHEWQVMDDPLRGILWISKMGHSFYDGDRKLVCGGCFISTRAIRNDREGFDFYDIRTTSGGHFLTKHQRKWVRNHLLDTLVPEIFGERGPSLIREADIPSEPRITLQDLAVRMGKKPREMREMLRAYGFRRNGPRWEWTQGEASGVLAELKRRYFGE